MNFNFNNLSPRVRRIVRWAGYPLLALFTFVLALHFTFPYERVKDKLIESLASKYDVTVGGVERGWVPGSMALTAVTLRSRPTRADEVPKTIFFNRLEVGVGVFALLGGTLEVEVEATVNGGTLAGEVRMKGKDTTASFTTSGVPLSNVPGVADLVGLPMGGKLNSSLELELPGGDWRKATGKIHLACPGSCSIGDGVTRIKPKARNSRQEAFAGEGIAVPKIFIDSLVADIVIAKGRASLEKFEVASKDGELFVNLELDLERAIKESNVRGCVKFKLTDEFKEREKDFGNVQALLGVPIDPDGFSNIEMKGKLKDIKRLPASKCDSSGAAPVPKPTDDFAGTGIGRPRPSLGAGSPEAVPGGLDGPATDTPVPPGLQGVLKPSGDGVTPTGTVEPGAVGPGANDIRAPGDDGTPHDAQPAPEVVPVDPPPPQPQPDLAEPPVPNPEGEHPQQPALPEEQMPAPAVPAE